MRIRLAGIAIALSVLACQQDRQNPAGVESEARDSAGIRIVENARPPEGSRLGWTIGPEPLLSIGVLEGEEPYMLHWAVNSVRLSDGRSAYGLHPGRKSSKVNKDCTICVFCLWAGPRWIET